MMENNHNTDSEKHKVQGHNIQEDELQNQVQDQEELYNLEDYDEEEETPELDEPERRKKTGMASHRDSQERSTNPKGKRKRTAGDFIRYTIMGIAAAVFIYSAYMLINIYLGYKEGTDTYKSIAATVLTEEPSAQEDTDADSTDTESFHYDHDALLRINAEGIGYLSIPAISVQLPVAQGTDNDYYLTHTFDRKTNGAGTLFEDYRITGGLASSHVIIYGHNMKNGSMFAGLKKYLTPSFYQTEGNDLFYLYTENKVMTYKIFSVYVSEPVSDTYTYNFGSLDALRDYAGSMKANSAYNTGVDISDTTQVVTFSTCTSDGSQRIIVQGTFVEENPLED